MVIYQTFFVITVLFCRISRFAPALVMSGYTWSLRKHFMRDEEKNYYKGCFYVIFRINKVYIEYSLYFILKYFFDYLSLYIILLPWMSLWPIQLPRVYQMSPIHVPKVSAHYFKHTSQPFKKNHLSLSLCTYYIWWMSCLISFEHCQSCERNTEQLNITKNLVHSRIRTLTRHGNQLTTPLS